LDETGHQPEGRAPYGEYAQQPEQPRYAAGQMRLSGERVEKGTRDQPRQERQQVHQAPPRPVEEIEPGRVAGHFQRVAPGWERPHRTTSSVATRSNPAKWEVGSAASVRRGPYSRTCPSSRTRMSSAYATVVSRCATIILVRPSSSRPSAV